jgi:hypothetical protein
MAIAMILDFVLLALLRHPGLVATSTTIAVGVFLVDLMEVIPVYASYFYFYFQKRIYSYVL